MKTKEEILEGFNPNSEYPNYYHESDVLAAMEAYATKFIKESNTLAKMLEQSFASQTAEGGEELMKDPFIKKHLERIWEKTKEAKIEIYIKPMFDNLSSLSIKYFLEKGTVNGGFLEALNNLMDSIRNQSSPPPPSSGTGKEELQRLKEIEQEVKGLVFTIDAGKEYGKGSEYHNGMAKGWQQLRKLIIPDSQTKNK